MKNFTKEELINLINNQQEFIREIEDSKGFVLDRCKEENVLPDLNFLVDNINVFSIKFITDNYNLSAEQGSKISEFLNGESLLNKNKIWTTEDIENALKNKELLPETVRLTAEQINKFQKEIKAQEELDDTEIYGIIRKSFRRFSKEEIMGLNEKFLINNHELVHDQASFFLDKEYKEFYKKIIFKITSKPILREFKNYVFEETDKEFLIKLLDNDKSDRDYSWGSQYQEYSKIKGFSSLIDKYEYFRKYQKNDLTSFTDGEVEKNADLFKSEFLKLDSLYSGYQPFDRFIRYKMSFNQFKTIVDEGFITKWMENRLDKDRNVERFVDYVDAEYDKSLVDKKIHFTNVVLKMCAENKEIKEGIKFNDNVSLYAILSLYKEMVNEKYSPVHGSENLMPEIKNSMFKIYENILPQLSDNSNILSLLHHNERLLGKDTLEFSQNFFKENPTINAFVLLLSAYQENVGSYFYEGNKRQYMELITSMINECHHELVNVKDKKERSSNKNAVNITLNYFKGIDKLKDDPFIKELSKKTSKLVWESKTDMLPNNFNLFNYEKMDLSLIDKDLWEIIYEMRPEFKKHIINNQITVPNELMFHCLNKIENQDNLNFVKEYVKLHRNEVDKNQPLVDRLLSSSKQTEIYPVANNELHEKAYKEAMVLLERLNVIDEKQDQIREYYPNMDMEYSRDKTGFPPIDLDKFNENMELPKNPSKQEVKSLFLDFYEKEKVLNKELEKCKNVISYGFMTEKLEKMIEEGDFQSVLFVNEKRIKYNRDVFINYVNNSSFETLMKDLNDSSFLNLLKGQLNYDKITDIKFSKFSYEQNMQLAEKFLDLYKVKKDERAYSFLYFFEQENRDFIKEFAIKNLPSNIFYGWDFLPPKSQTYKPSNFITENYSKEEIYEAFKNLEATDGFFSNTETNSKFDTFFQYALFGDRPERGKPHADDNFKEFLAFIKEKDDVLYAAMAYSQIWEACLDFGRSYGDEKPRKYQTRDQGINAYFHENFDFDQVLKGVDKIITRLENRRRDYDEDSVGEVVNPKNANYCITSVVHNTYYEHYGEDGYSRNSDYRSVTSEEDTLKLMKFLFKRAPMHFVERHVFGKASDPVAYFKKHIDEFSDFESVKNFLLPHPEVIPEYLRVDDEQSEHRNRLIDYTKTIIENAVDKKDYKVVGFIKHLVEQHQFLSKEVNRSMARKAYDGVSSIFVEVIAEDKAIRGMLEKAKLKMNLDESLEIKTPVKRRAQKI